MATPKTLNIIWHMAIASAASDLPIAAINAVMVVPTLAPKIKGKSFFGVILLVDARITEREVVTEEEWIAAVIPAPDNKERKELLKAPESHFPLFASSIRLLKMEESV